MNSLRQFLLLSSLVQLNFRNRRHTEWLMWQWERSFTLNCIPAALAHAQQIFLRTTLCLTFITPPSVGLLRDSLYETHSPNTGNIFQTNLSKVFFVPYISKFIHTAASHPTGCEILFRLGASALTQKHLKSFLWLLQAVMCFPFFCDDNFLHLDKDLDKQVVVLARKANM